MKALSDELSEEKKKEIDLLAKRFLKLNDYQMDYLHSVLQEKVMKNKNLSYLQMNFDWFAGEEMFSPPNWFTQQETMAKLGPFMAELMPKAAPVQQIVQQQPKVTKKIEAPKNVEPEKPVEKDFYSVEITSYAPTAKIRIIKEYRAIVGLGLKEAKQNIEKVPLLAFSKLKKDEAEALIKKFEGYGAKMKLI